LLRPRVGAVADLAGIDGDGLGSRISVAQLCLHAGDDLRQMRADEFAARLFVARGAIEAGKHVDRLASHADRAELPFDPDVHESVGPACPDRIIFHAYPPYATAVHSGYH